MKIDHLEQFTTAFGALLREKPARAELIQNGRELLGELVLNRDWLRPILSGLVLDEAFLKAQWHSIDSNEIQIYRSGDKQFSMRAYIWEPNIIYPIHDHGAWGIVGAHINPVRERKYIRTDDGREENRAELRQVSEQILSPGGTTFVLPVNEGIHQMEAPGDRTVVTIHVYGAPVRKGYIRYFEPARSAVRRVYPPAVAKKIYAIRTLGSISDSWAEEVLSASVCSDTPDYIKLECRESLRKLTCN